MQRSIASLVAAGVALLTLPACDSEPVVSTDAARMQVVRAPEWSEPENLGAVVNTSGREIMPALSADGRTLYFVSDREGGFGGNDIWVTQKTQDGEWGAPVNLGELVNSTAEENNPALSTDGRLLFFDSNRPGGYGRLDLYVARRVDPAIHTGWSSPINLGSELNSDLADRAPAYVAAAPGAPAMLYFARGIGLQRSDLYVSAITRDGQPLSHAIPIAELNRPGVVTDAPSLSADGREILFWSNREGGADLWTATRESPNHTWATPIRLGPPLNTAFAEERPELSRDGRVLLFDSNRLGFGGQDIWISHRNRP